MNFKILIAASIAAASLTGHAFAGNHASANAFTGNRETGNGETKNGKTAFSGETVNAKVVARFNSDFKGASGIWNIEGSYDEIFFVWHNELMQSYYTKDGQLIGTYHCIEASKLPAAALLTIFAGYRGYQLKNASVVERPGQEPGYFAALIGKTKIVKLEISADGEVNEL